MLTLIRLLAVAASVLSMSAHAQSGRVLEKLDRQPALETRLNEAFLARRLDDRLLWTNPVPRKLSDIPNVLTPRLPGSRDRVVTEGDGPGSQGEALRRLGNKLPPPEVAAAAAQIGSTVPTTCSQNVVKELEAAQLGVDGVPVDGVDADARLYRHLLKHKAAAKETPASLAAIRRLEAAWRFMLKDCFTAPDSRPGFARVAGRIGAFSVPDRAPFCSGTLLEDGQILTARHCFVDRVTGMRTLPDAGGLVFALADGSASLRINLDDALKSAGPFSSLEDWIIVPAPKLNKPLPKLDLVDRLLSFTEAAASNSEPTRLEAFAVIPLASAIDPKLYPVSIVGYALNGCFVAHQRSHCITHLCGAVQGGSGASLFVQGAAKPAWAGMHIGPESSVISCSGQSDSIVANLALRSNAAFQHHFNPKDSKP